MYFLVFWQQDFSIYFRNTLLPAYLTECLNCSDQLKNEVLMNASQRVYESRRGVRTNIERNLVTGLWSTSLSEFISRTTLSLPDEQLVNDICSHWEWVLQNVPPCLPVILVPPMELDQETTQKIPAQSKSQNRPPKKKRD
eukprot:TRINITY_DN1589_c0_g1_i17.p1 TRINITY_DN1589_c0_g1~~TRINITY_DN1589_c0_g1_i17.p1  ORF type:complete len:140 (-),score=16.82 TRINITY_DN1589_c0_g1_i17:110-529(-)